MQWLKINKENIKKIVKLLNFLKNSIRMRIYGKAKRNSEKLIISFKLVDVKLLNFLESPWFQVITIINLFFPTFD